MKIMILQKSEALIDLNSLKMTPFADFRFKNQTPICHTSISLAIWKFPLTRPKNYQNVAPIK